MRVWDCDPRLLCDKHLRAQHAEIHFAIRVIENGWKTRWKDVERFRRHEHGLEWLAFLHGATVFELQRRGRFRNHSTPVELPEWALALLYYWSGCTFRPSTWLVMLTEVGYPPTELNQGTPWERDGVSFEWYRAHEKDWTRQLARDEAKRNLATNQTALIGQV